MARRIRPFVEREAVWAFVLACLGFVSMYATLPAAVVLAARAIRRRGVGGDGSEPAIAVLALGTVWLSFLLGYPAMRAVVLEASQAGAITPRVALGGVALLAAAIWFLADFAVRSHPERWIARSSAVAGIAVATAAAFVEVVVLVIVGSGSLPRIG